MLFTYFKTAYRNITKHVGYTITNIVGLSLAVVLGIYSYLYITDELSFDRFHDRADNIYRINWAMVNPGTGPDGRTLSLTPPALRESIVEELEGQAKHAVRIKPFNLIVNKESNSFRETVSFVDEGFFELFTFPLLQGDKQTVLDTPNSAVLSKDMVVKYFGNKNPVGENIRVQLRGKFTDFEITGIADNPPENSTIQYGIILSYNWLAALDRENYVDLWQGATTYNFVELADGVSESTFEANMQGLVNKYFEDVLSRSDDSSVRLSFTLQPIKDLHLNTFVQDWPSIPVLGIPGSNILYSYMLILIAVIVIVIASINYVTFSLGYSTKRATEIGVRKSLGASRKSLIYQFWIETGVLTFMALLVGIVIVNSSISVFNSILDKQLTSLALISVEGVLAFVGLWLIISFTSGFYPSFVFSSFEPSKVLKGSLSVSHKKLLSKVLVGVQCSGAFVLIIGVIVISKQLNYVQDQVSLSDNEQILIIQNQRDANGSFLNSYANLKSELNRQGITNVTGSYGVIDDDNFGGSYGVSDEQISSTSIFFVDYNYLDIYGLELAEGRFFDEDFSTDSRNAVVVNEAFLRDQGPGVGVGTVLQSVPDRLSDAGAEIVGVIKDYHFESLHTEVEPVVFLLIREDIPTRYLSVAFKSRDYSDVFEKSQAAWKSIHPDLPFEYSFFDERFEQLYLVEEQWKKIIGYSSALAILIACLGLLALTSLSVENRKKEVGIRKVLGAELWEIVYLFIHEFFRPVAGAFILAIPISIYGLNYWLNNFAYKVDVGVIPFAMSFAIISGLAALAISYHAIRSGKANPVDALRSE